MQVAVNQSVVGEPAWIGMGKYRLHASSTAALRRPPDRGDGLSSDRPGRNRSAESAPPSEVLTYRHSGAGTPRARSSLRPGSSASIPVDHRLVGRPSEDDRCAVGRHREPSTLRLATEGASAEFEAQLKQRH